VAGVCSEERRVEPCLLSEGALACWAKIITGRNTIAKAKSVRFIALLLSWGV